MVELVLTFVLKLVGLGLGYYLVHSVFSKKTKDFHLSANQCGIEVDSSFYLDNILILNPVIHGDILTIE